MKKMPHSFRSASASKPDPAHCRRAKKLAVCRLPQGRPAGGRCHEPHPECSAQRARPVCLPQGCADPAAYAQKQPDRRVTAPSLATCPTVTADHLMIATPVESRCIARLLTNELAFSRAGLLISAQFSHLSGLTISNMTWHWLDGASRCTAGKIVLIAGNNRALVTSCVSVD